MIQHVTIEVNNRIYKNIFSIFVFVLYNIFVNTINYGTILLIVFLEFLYLLLSHTIAFFIPLLIIFLYILIALEETYHIAMIVYFGKQDSISHIDITRVKIGFICFVGGVCVCYKGMFKKSEIFYIAIAGPLMPVFYLLILAIILYLIKIITPFNTTMLLKILLYSSIAPLSALIPINSGNYRSDGYQIMLFIRENKISCKYALLTLLYIVKNMLRVTINFSLKGTK